MILYRERSSSAKSYWSIYGLGGPGPRGQNFWLPPDDTSFRRGKQFWNFRQVMHYVRPGAVRIGTTCDEPGLRPLAFSHHGRITVVLINTTPRAVPQSVTVDGLPSADYGACQCVSAKPYEELGVKTVGTDGRLNVHVPAKAVLTVCPHSGRNLAPVVVNWDASPTYLKQSNRSVTLSAPAQDPELDPLSFSWTVTHQPPGAAVTIAKAHSAETEADGFNMAGQYTLTVRVTDGTDEVKRDVLLNVYEGNQPPRILDVHNRIPVVVTLPQSETLLRAGHSTWKEIHCHSSGRS